jgi:hypothetical protein
MTLQDKVARNKKEKEKNLAGKHVNTILLGAAFPLHALCGTPTPSAILVRHDRGSRTAHIFWWGCG